MLTADFYPHVDKRKRTDEVCVALKVIYSQKFRRTKTLWSNCTVVGFSKKFFRAGEKASRSSGIHRSPILGKELYTSPASRPATKAPATQNSLDKHP